MPRFTNSILPVIDDPEGTVPITTWFDVFEHVARELGSDAVMFDIFNTMDVGAFSVFDYLFICAPTLRDACKAWKALHADAHQRL
ncbi:AraC family transcriptional regulator ligand-binding domain-containing protein [uncultured Roseibium sp.]|uniref:AraC family transcriptional regulator ligand-binding domain-containing protein n=1 Tax=uncultured Roseibium sp. TaxID=1936171 RepID=UPI003216D1FD